MQLTDRMLRETRELEKKKNKQIQVMRDPEEDETGMMYMPRPASKYLNSGDSVFDYKDQTSINTALSVFDRTAIFTVER